MTLEDRIKLLELKLELTELRLERAMEALEAHGLIKPLPLTDPKETANV
jgi:ribosomal protein L29